MPRHVFGWSYPPGAANDPNAPYNQTDDVPCAVCCKVPDQCICPECPQCSEQGNAKCYTAMRRGTEGHGMKLTREQAISRGEAEVKRAQDALHDAECALNFLKDGGEFNDDLADSPDPWR
jgi:hypothetical protein